MKKTILTMQIRFENDVVLSRQRARQIAESLGFDRQEQTRIATAISEISRNTFEYVGSGTVEFAIEDSENPPLFQIAIQDTGRGIPDLNAILEGRYVSTTGMGKGITGAKRLMEHFRIDSIPGTGTTVTLGKKLPGRNPDISAQKLKSIAEEIAGRDSQNPFVEVQAQNRELLRALEELQTRQAELAQLNRELEDTNRGVLALYAELDEKAESLKKASETKTSFLSNMTHEFRTPLNSILGLSRVALSGEDGDLGIEHRKQVTFIQKSAEGLSELVNDLLDIAKVEAGKIDLKPSHFNVAELFGALRGALKPLLLAQSTVSLLFEDSGGLPPLHTDEGKLSQILRNLISNALKFTEKGEVRVSAQIDRASSQMTFSVSDTGIGIAPEDQERIFDEFTQLESPLQKRSKGTGLGLSLSRKLAGLLGGSLSVESKVGEGSTFVFALPLGLSDTHGARNKVLIIDDHEDSRYLLKELLRKERFLFIEASDGIEGLSLAREAQPQLIFLDLHMPRMSGFYVLDQLKAHPVTRSIPVIVHTSMTLTPTEFADLEKHAVAIISKDLTSSHEGGVYIQKALTVAGMNTHQRAENGQASHG